MTHKTKEHSILTTGVDQAADRFEIEIKPCPPMPPTPPPNRIIKEGPGNEALSLIGILWCVFCIGIAVGGSIVRHQIGG